MTKKRVARIVPVPFELKRLRLRESIPGTELWADPVTRLT